MTERTIADGAHEWFRPSFLKFDCCRKCGIVKRADGRNSPCPGNVHVALRTSSPAPAKEA